MGYCSLDLEIQAGDSTAVKDTFDTCMVWNRFLAGFVPSWHIRGEEIVMSHYSDIDSVLRTRAKLQNGSAPLNPTPLNPGLCTPNSLLFRLWNREGGHHTLGLLPDGSV